MDFEYSAKVKTLQTRLQRVHGRTRLSERAALSSEEVRRGRPLAADAAHRGAEAEGARGGPVEPVPAASPSYGAGPDQPRIRAALRDHGPRRHGRPRSSTAPRPTPATWRRSSATGPRAAEARMARAAARRRDPLLLRDDRARRRLIRRHQYRKPHRARRATTTSSTAASGGPPGAGDPRCKLFIFMGKTDPRIRTGTSSSR